MTVRLAPIRTGAIGVLLLLFTASAARADAIDGDWCLDAKTMSIRGSDIVTPGGKRMKGDYTRHSFSYIIPTGEPGAGQTIDMTLRSEYLLHARQRGKDAPLQEWRRCSAKTS
jgi:hypothetical protein